MTSQFASRFRKDPTVSANHNGCVAVCLSIGTFKEYITDVLPSYIYTKKGEFESWHRLCQNVEFGFISQYDHDVIINSIPIDPLDNIRSFTLQPNKLIWSMTPLCSKYQVLSSINSKELSIHKACYSGIIVLNSTTTPKQPLYPINQAMINTSIHNSWNHSLATTRTFTKYGFEKVRLPSDLWSSMLTYYHNNRHSLSFDYSQYDNFHSINWWNTTIISLQKIEIPPILNKFWLQMIGQYVERWALMSSSPSPSPSSPSSSIKRLQFASLPAFRVFSEGSYQLPHVEMKKNIAFSVLINIDQTELLVPWSTQIYDFSGRLHEITMVPGDILVYESAKLLSGRIFPLNGRQYVDLMIHYSPLQPEEWYFQTNPLNGITPLGEVTDCHQELIQESDPTGDLFEQEPYSITVCTEINSGNSVEMPFLSPSLTRISSGNDLFDLWLSLQTKSKTAEPLETIKTQEGS